jgi:hypothetical protein
MKTKNELNKDKKIDILVKNNYNQIENPGSLGGVKRLYDQLKVKNKNVNQDEITSYLTTKDEYSLHRPIQKNFSRNKFVVAGIDDTWQMDLVDIKAFKKENKNYTFILTVIDVFSKYAWGRMLINKNGETVLSAIKSIFSSKRKPKRIHSDKGTEFFNKDVKNFFKEQNIQHYITYSDMKASIVERFNRTLKERMWRHFTATKSKIYHDVFDKFFISYNSSYHSSIKMSPNQVNKSNSDKVFFNIYGYDINEGDYDFNVKINFKVGEFVRISRYKHVFSKGYDPNWTNEVFEVIEINLNYQIPVYKLKDLMGVTIEGSFYSEELQKVSINIREYQRRGEFLVDWILDTRVRKGKKEYFVSWKYYPESENSWIEEKDWVK